ncbi:DUF413 domain-containing protein [Vibrio sp. ZSDE26]|uniref:Macrodomain Ori protein n=1 Tax=Vibrio amylolyticus TaxID=2847292 RepID=A0A9X2BFQ6_9VIBR|nr:DUF413 domain-containing protein [Vibrio amylolyticus]MCK6262026.1 DUF413 domain-containing protein [Vibrio amylolyticus]
MIDTQFRHGKKRFYDMVKFPRGFAKSGDFTLIENEILMTYGETMLALETGEISPANSDEKHFIKVLKHPAKAKTKLEHIWLKYVNLARGRRAFHTLNSRTKFHISSQEFDHAVNDDEVIEVA